MKTQTCCQYWPKKTRSGCLRASLGVRRRLNQRLRHCPLRLNADQVDSVCGTGVDVSIHVVRRHLHSRGRRWREGCAECRFHAHFAVDTSFCACDRNPRARIRLRDKHAHHRKPTGGLFEFGVSGFFGYGKTHCGDEFTFIITELVLPKQGIAVARHMMDAITGDIDARDGSHPVTCAAGLVAETLSRHNSPPTAELTERMIQLAGRAMFEAKQRTRTSTTSELIMGRLGHDRVH